jgi:orotate phosphoribosyltransferase
MEDYLNRRLNELIHELGCIKYADKDEYFQLASGRTSDYKVILDPLFEDSISRWTLGTIGQRIVERIERERKLELVGAITGGNELAKIIARRMGRESLGVDPHNDEPVSGFSGYPLVCEDTLTTGGSILRCVRKLGYGGDAYALAIVDREEGGRENLEKNKVKLYSMTTRTKLGIKSAASEGKY